MRWLWAPLLMLSTVAAADPVVLRMASVAPSGSPWARELANFGRQVEAGTAGEVRVRWYFNAVAGDEEEEWRRLQSGQLDGAASGQMLCEQAAPSLRISHLPGTFQDRDEAALVLGALQSVFEREAHGAGYQILALTGLGPSLFLTRRPVGSLDELRKVRLWRWSFDRVGTVGSKEMGLDVSPLPLYEAGPAFSAGRIDGFVGIPSAALAFQWSAQARYLVDLRVDYLFGCLVVSERAFSRLPPSHQVTLREAAAKLRERYEDMGRRIDDSLIGGLFQRQGITVLPVSEAFRAEFFAAARVAREKMGDRFVSKELLARVQSLLADYRAEHPTRAGSGSR